MTAALPPGHLTLKLLPLASCPAAARAGAAPLITKLPGWPVTPRPAFAAPLCLSPRRQRSSCGADAWARRRGRVPSLPSPEPPVHTWQHPPRLLASGTCSISLALLPQHLELVCKPDAGSLPSLPSLSAAAARLRLAHSVDVKRCPQVRASQARRQHTMGLLWNAPHAAIRGTYGRVGATERQRAASRSGRDSCKHAVERVRVGQPPTGRGQ